MTGDLQTVITQEQFETETDYHRQGDLFASLVDSEGTVWDGMSLRALMTELDMNNKGDLNQQGISTSADGEDQKNVIMTITSTDGKELTLGNEEIFGPNNYLLAQVENGNYLSATDPAYPLVLVGKDLNKEDFISGVSTITLHHG